MSVLSGVLATLRKRKSRANEQGTEPPAPTHVTPRPAPAPEPASTPDLEQIAAEARYHRDRLALYRARMHRAVASLSGLRQPERAAEAADVRLRHAQLRRHKLERTVAADATLRHADGG
jgi:hypothetical protein